MGRENGLLQGALLFDLQIRKMEHHHLHGNTHLIYNNIHGSDGHNEGFTINARRSCDGNSKDMLSWRGICGKDLQMNEMDQDYRTLPRDTMCVNAKRGGPHAVVF